MIEKYIKEHLKNMMEWYHRLDICYEMIKFLKNREFACLVPKMYKDTYMNKVSCRNFRVHSVQNTHFVMNKQIDYFSKNIILNLYTSLAKYKSGLPYFDGNFVKRKPQVEFWNANSYKDVIGYDLFIDIDAKKHKDMDLALNSVYNIISIFDRYSVPYTICFSGMGFHVVVPYKFFKGIRKSFNPWAKDNIYEFYHKILEKLHNEHSEMVDLSVTDTRRLIKLPYSLTFYDNDVYVVSPLLSRQELRNFKVENYTFLNMRKNNFSHRGIKVFNEQDEYNYEPFLKYMEVLEWEEDV